ncbi:MAG: hypothetical protein PF961_11955 [Planctomycetota bacterium]|jgi:hypothetical protein|nr:hypothetical protein [Planctomycetota bacterium]
MNANTKKSLPVGLFALLVVLLWAGNPGHDAHLRHAADVINRKNNGVFPWAADLGGPEYREEYRARFAEKMRERSAYRDFVVFSLTDVYEEDYRSIGLLWLCFVLKGATKADVGS